MGLGSSRASNGAFTSDRTVLPLENCVKDNPKYGGPRRKSDGGRKDWNRSAGVSATDKNGAARRVGTTPLSGLYFLEQRLEMGGAEIFHPAFPADRGDAGSSKPAPTALSRHARTLFVFAAGVRHTYAAYRGAPRGMHATTPRYRGSCETNHRQAMIASRVVVTGY